MKNLTNYHSHSLFCDGRAALEDFVRFALSEGFTSYGFSSHAPLPFATAWTMEWNLMDDYLNEFSRLKEKYRDRIELYVGLEIDYLNEDSHAGIRRFRELPLDYRIASVHLLPTPAGETVDIDTTPDRFRVLTDTCFNGDLDAVVRLYYSHLERMVELGGFDIVGHADKMHYNAQCYRPGLLDEPWYDELVKTYFRHIADKGYQMEVNTKAFAHTGVLYPNARYLKYLHGLGIRVQVNSDAHYPDLINSGRREALRLLREAGYTTVMEMHDGKWVEMPIIL